MTLYTGCIYHSPHKGLRISIMSQHTLDDGITPDPLITSASYDQWFHFLGPPLKLIGSYYKRGLSWNDFEKEYVAYLQQEPIFGAVKRLAKIAVIHDLTFLCQEETPERCHRRLLVQECKRMNQELKIIVK